jgi:hypothetical protein
MWGEGFRKVQETIWKNIEAVAEAVQEAIDCGEV